MLNRARIRRRSLRSRNTPAKGPMTLNGSSTAASAAAMLPASACFSGENSRYDASAIWNTPSPNWLVTRTTNSSRKRCPRSRCRSTARKLIDGLVSLGSPGVGMLVPPQAIERDERTGDARLIQIAQRAEDLIARVRLLRSPARHRAVGAVRPAWPRLLRPRRHPASARPRRAVCLRLHRRRRRAHSGRGAARRGHPDHR